MGKNNSYKADFPIFGQTQGLIYLDSAATSLKPKRVVDAIVSYYTQYSANIQRGIYKIAQLADEEYEKARYKIHLFIGSSSPDEVIFVPGATWGLNMLAKSIGKACVKKGDNIVVTKWEHHSNLVPWQEMALEKGARLQFISLEEDAWDKVINEKTKLVAFSMVGNVLGEVHDVRSVCHRIKAINSDCLIVIDGAQAVSHIPVNVSSLGCDFFVFSGHKLYGPTGIGVVWGKEEAWYGLPKFVGGGGTMKKVTVENFQYKSGVSGWEAGTPNISGAIGLGAAVSYLMEYEAEDATGKLLGMEGVKSHERSLTKKLIGDLGRIPGIKIYGDQEVKRKVGLVSFNIKDIHAHDVAHVLSETNICVRAGNHCAMPLHSLLGIDGSVRASLGIYCTENDISALVLQLERIAEKFR
jgi:cysteine desulfurase/selenocysteine lyase